MGRVEARFVVIFGQKVDNKTWLFVVTYALTFAVIFAPEVGSKMFISDARLAAPVKYLTLRTSPILAASGHDLRLRHSVDLSWFYRLQKVCRTVGKNTYDNISNSKVSNHRYLVPGACLFF
jgi:hypothetical protein